MPAILSLFSGLWGYVASALAAAALSGYLVHTFDDDTYQKLKLADAQASIRASQVVASIQKKIDAANLASALQEEKAQQQIITQTQTVTKEIPVYVHDTISCPGPSVGLARLLYASAAGVDPATVSLAAGQSDDACSDVTASEVASWFSQFAGAARENAEQLNALEASIRSLSTAQGAGQSGKYMDTSGP